MRRAVVIFARSPRAEAAAKRLAGRRGTRLFEAVAASWMRAARRCGAVVFVACERSHRAGFPAGIRFIDQTGASFGERLAAAAGAAFSSGFDSVLVTGIDAPPPSGLEAEFAAVEGGAARSVVVPSFDGGVNCILLRRHDAALLVSFEIGDGTLLGRCRAWFGDGLRELAFVTDIDSAAATVAARGQPAWRRYADLLLPQDPDIPAVPQRQSLCQIRGVSLRAPPAA
ncbi:MAG TPA: DUF2064 domain-containing protein [Thermoanaerobaculia bacterium]|nr:DUF2064 domain-containing protein [Thermoanaerobaculia bacterium]